MKLPISIAAFLVSSAFAFADGPKGIAFVEAPEQSSGLCFADNADKGFACAKKECTANGTISSDCLRVKWCYPAGWSADIFMQHKEGPHWHQYLCGWASRQDVELAAKVMCEGSQKEWLIECSIVSIWDPEGKKIPSE
ncbi:MAG: hypothetical protein AAF412_14705 [Pseudomonadota bacterium]